MIKFSNLAVYEYFLYSGKTLQQVSAETGIDAGRISKFMNGKGNLNQSQIALLADSIGVCPGLFYVRTL